MLQSVTEVLQSITDYYRVLQSITETNLAHLLGPIFGLVFYESVPNKYRQILTKKQRWKKARTSCCLFFGVGADFKRFELIYSLFRLISGIFTCFFVCLFFPRQKVVNAVTYFFPCLIQSLFYNYGTILAFVF